jgi:hypothetical protein
MLSKYQTIKAKDTLGSQRHRKQILKSRQRRNIFKCSVIGEQLGNREGTGPKHLPIKFNYA